MSNDQQENRQLRVTQLETALARSHATSETLAHKQEAEGQRRNVNDAVREALITSLQSENKQLLIRIDKDAFELASAEDRLRELSRELILAHEREQRRIAQDLHDELGQALTALKMLLGRGKGASGKAVSQVLTEAGEISESMLQTVRDICSRLRPQVLDDLGLVAGLSVHLKHFGDRTGLAIEFDHGEIDDRQLTPIVQSAVFRVIQEAVTNVARHAQTQQARVSIGMDGDALVFTIEDKGCGFDAETIKSLPSTGLSSMAERILLVDGVCQIVSSPGKGTAIKSRIPLKN